jgi:hypothetical protein
MEHEESLEWYMKNFRETCEKCHSDLSVHAFRRKSPGKRKIVYCSCLNKTCGKYHAEIAFYGS